MSVRRLIKLLVLAIIANTLYQFVPPYLRYIRFKDGVRETALFSERLNDVQIVDRVMALADRLEVPIDRDAVQVSRPESNRVRVEGSYVEPMWFVPWRQYDWQFDVSVDARHVKAPGELP